MCGNLLCVALLSIIAGKRSLYLSLLTHELFKRLCLRITIFNCIIAVHSQNNMTTTMVPTTTSTTMVPTTTPMQPLNCTNIPEVPIKPLDGNITDVLALANDNIRVCNLIIPCK